MKFLPVIVLPLLLIVAPLLSHGQRHHKYLPLQAPEMTEAKLKLEAVDFAPFSYYEGACARCHGENGANYGDLLAKHTDERLHEGINMMAKGPGQSPLSEPQLQVMVKWHRALLEGKPFAHLVKIERGEKTLLSGEATPEAKVILKSGAQTFEAQREGAKWTIEAPKDVDLEAAELSAQAPSK